jgi:hypothetical protein
MDVVKVNALLLRQLLPDLPLQEGARFVARVAARPEGQHGTLMLGGVPLVAQLPDEVEAGEVLRLTVQEVSAERILLKMEPPQVAPAAVPLLPPQSREGAARVAVREGPRRTGAAAEDVGVALAFESAALGRLDLRIDLAAGTVRAGVEAPAGQAFALASDHAEELREALEAHLPRRADVQVRPRREPLDVYA